MPKETVEELLGSIYKDNKEHFDFIEARYGDCDCHIHSLMVSIDTYRSVE